MCRSEQTLQLLILRNEDIPERFIVGLGKLLTGRKMQTIETQWRDLQKKERGERLILTDGSSIKMIYGLGR